ncbi:unnamed protein product [Symbiodinium pilosum]|uniref:EF-hand domain-containing protein n=1 Tax=Symbiodinium pilosum TaxID=2952 RepID=A0A812VDF6_SYMPI|nr:unnamed protein product [Symbiodinium pilosum]
MYGPSGSKGKGKGERSFGGYSGYPNRVAERDDRDRRDRVPPSERPLGDRTMGDRRGGERRGDGPMNDRRRDARSHVENRPSGPPRGPESRRSGAGGVSGAAVPPPASVSAGGHSPDPTIHVSGCSNDTVSNIIQGLYNTKESNHNKPVYKKEGPPGSVTVLIYYWDERDGPSFNGWWFGPKVGGDQVWAYNGGNLGRENVMPPTSNWKVPWDGKVDEKLRISVGAPPRTRDRDPREKREEEKRRREEEERRQREEARRRRQREEEQARREAEARRRRQEEERKQEEAANNVREVMKKLRNATPDNWKGLQADLDKAAASNFQAMGALRDRVNDEMQQVITQVQKRIAEELKQREEAERRRQMELARVEQLLKEAAAEVQATEARVGEAQEATKAACQLGLEASTAPEEILQAVQRASQDLQDAKNLLERSERVLSMKREAMGAGEGARHVKSEVEELSSRLQSSGRSLQRCKETLEETRGRGLRRALALKVDQEWMQTFKRFDLDGDGELCGAEVSSFGKEEFQVELRQEVLQKILRVLEPVTFEKFLRFRQKVGIAKFEAEARRRRAEEAEQLRQAEAQRQQVQEMVEVITAQLEEGKLKLQQVSEELKALLEVPASEAIASGTVRAESQGQEVRSMLDSLSRQLDEATGVLLLEPKLKKEVFRLQEQHRILEVQLEKVLSNVKTSKEAVAKKAQKEVLELRAKAVKALRSRMTQEGQSGDEVFEAAAGGSDALDSESFKALLKDLDAETALERLFVSVTKGGGQLDRASFLEFIRFYFRCVKGTVLSEEICIKSKTVRRLEVDEVLEVLEGPSKDEGANVQRVRCLAVQDGARGWATIAGNQGTPFLVQVQEPQEPQPSTEPSGGPDEPPQRAERAEVAEVAAVPEVTEVPEIDLEHVEHVEHVEQVEDVPESKLDAVDCDQSEAVDEVDAGTGKEEAEEAEEAGEENAEEEKEAEEVAEGAEVTGGEGGDVGEGDGDAEGVQGSAEGQSLDG